MGSRISELIREVESIYLKIKSINNEICVASRNNKNGIVQQLLHTRRYLQKKLFNCKCRFISILKGDISYIKYEYVKDQNNYVSEAILVNMTNKEIEDVLKLYCKFNGYTFIRILEIKRTPTKLC